MDSEEILYLLALQKVKGIGSINAKKLIAHLGSAQAVFTKKRSELTKINGFGPSFLKDVNTSEVLKKASVEWEYIQQNNIKYSSFLDDDYPDRLKHCIDGPILLFQDGNIEYNKQPVISIVGTRKMTSYGRSFLKSFIHDLKTYNPIIISGFAYGVDITAHRFAMDYGLQTIGVLAHGLDEMYPPQHKKHVHKVLENGGFYTEYWHDEKALRENFLMRNRIIAGLSDATIIVESATKGGSLVTAHIANSYNRDVFAVPGRVKDTFSQGCNNLIRTNRAALLQSVENLAYMLNWDQDKQTKKTIQPKLFLNLDQEQQKIYDYLLEKGKTLLDQLALDTQIPIYKLSGILVEMEMMGVIKPLPGKMFEVI